MTDEAENTDEVVDGAEDVQQDTANFLSCETGELIFPHGFAWYAAHHGFARLFVEYKTGQVTGEDVETGVMRKPTRKRAASDGANVVPIK